jgi:sugar O-acyltransferase (sialic acid O-acetyltransferase NeuD family)
MTSERRKVVIFGTGDFARVAAIYLREDSDDDVVAFTVDEQYMSGEQLDGVPVVPFEKLGDLHPPSEHAMLVAIGFSGVNKARARVYERCKERGYELISYVNSRATHWGALELGDNCFVFEENVIQPNVRIGNDVVIWSGNHIGHDSEIGDHCFVASHAVISGNVRIGPYCFIGVNATVRDGVTIAPECVIGASALIMRDTEPGGVYSVRGTQVSEKRSWDLDL